MKKATILYAILVSGLVSRPETRPKVYSDITYDTFFKTEKQVLSAAGPAYQSWNAYPSPECIWSLSNFGRPVRLPIIPAFRF